MSKTALIEGLETFDIDKVGKSLEKDPALKQRRLGKGFDLLQYASSRMIEGDTAKADRQLRLAKWLVSQGFDPRVIYTTQPGEDGEEEVAHLSLVWFAVARAQNTALARYFLEQGAAAGALFAAAWWGNWEIAEDLVRHGEDINADVGGTPLHMAVDVLYRGVEGKPARARRRSKLLQELLRLGADPNLRDAKGFTPLHLALHKGYGPDAFKLLLRHGADPDSPGPDGRTVREIAARKKDRRYIKALALPA